MTSRAPARTPLEDAVARVGDRWTLLIVNVLLGGPRRFMELTAALDGIAPNVLSQRLKDLEKDGLVVSAPYSRRPLRLSYALSGGGRELADALRLLAAWGARASTELEGPRHRSCGTPLETRWFCPTCDRVTSDPNEDDVRYL